MREPSDHSQQEGQNLTGESAVNEMVCCLTKQPPLDLRRQIAAMPDVPSCANLILAVDSDENVRMALASKLSRQGDGLTVHSEERHQRIVWFALAILAHDPSFRVRQILSECMASRPCAPLDILLILGRDSELGVALPVLGDSPALNDETLVELVRAAPSSAHLVAIASRPDISEVVADALVSRGEVSAAEVLVANTTARFRPQTLERLAAILGPENLGVLWGRSDYVKKEELKFPIQPENERTTEYLSTASMKEIRDAISRGDREAIINSLAKLADVKPEIVSKILQFRSASGIMAIAYRAGLAVRLAVELQHRVANIPTENLLRPIGGLYPMGADEVDWQIQFFNSLVAAKAV